MAEDLGIIKDQNRIDDPIKSLDLLGGLELALFCISVINFFLLSTILYAIAILCSNHKNISKNDHDLEVAINSSNDSVSDIYQDSSVQSSIKDYDEQSEILMESLEGNQRYSESISFSLERISDENFLQDSNNVAGETARCFAVAGETARVNNVAGETARVINVDSSYVDSLVEDSDQASNYYSKKSVSSNSSKSTVTIAIL